VSCHGNVVDDTSGMHTHSTHGWTEGAVIMGSLPAEGRLDRLPGIAARCGESDLTRQAPCRLMDSEVGCLLVR
jgi:hypothetical protein